MEDEGDEWEKREEGKKREVIKREKYRDDRHKSVCVRVCCHTSRCRSGSLIGSVLSRTDGKDPPIISPDVCT